MAILSRSGGDIINLSVDALFSLSVALYSHVRPLTTPLHPLTTHTIHIIRHTPHRYLPLFYLAFAQFNIANVRAELISIYTADAFRRYV